MSDSPRVPFSRRSQQTGARLVDSDFPDSARQALVYVLDDVMTRRYVARGWAGVAVEAARLCRSPRPEVGKEQEARRVVEVHIRNTMKWNTVFDFCERLYANLLEVPLQYDSFSKSMVPAIEEELAEIQTYFEAEMNNLLLEEGIAYEFRDGAFIRPGRHHTQTVIATASRVMVIPELRDARAHFNKALRFFGDGPSADNPNTIKEAVSALEAATKALFPDIRADNFNKIVDSLRGTGETQIPPTLAKAMLGLYDFRGACAQVAHGGATGGVATPAAAELAISLSASFIIFLVDLRSLREEQVPV